MSDVIPLHPQRVETFETLQTFIDDVEKVVRIMERDPRFDSRWVAVARQQFDLACLALRESIRTAAVAT